MRSRDQLVQAFASESSSDNTCEPRQPVQKPDRSRSPEPVQAAAQTAVQTAVRGPVRTTDDPSEPSVRTGPDDDTPTTDMEELDLELRHLGRTVQTYRTWADPTHSAMLVQLLRDAIRRTGGQDTDAGDYELVVRYTGELGVMTTVVAPPQLPGGLVGVA